MGSGGQPARPRTKLSASLLNGARNSVIWPLLKSIILQKYIVGNSEYERYFRVTYKEADEAPGFS